MTKTKTSDDTLGNRMKSYEAHETLRRSMQRLPLCVRMDGRAFHTFTRGLDRPFDEGFSRAMIETTKYLVEETNAKVGYTQSDEITLVFWDGSYRSEPLFGGKLFKLTSVLASMTTAKFNSLVPMLIPKRVGRFGIFDARVFQVPSLEEAANLLLWRWLDARKNSISMAAQSVYSAKQLHQKDSGAKLEMLQEKGVVWEDYPSHLKGGTFIQRKKVERLLTEEELDRIPEAHRPEGPVIRHAYIELDLPPLLSITNRPQVLFEGAEPVVEGSFLIPE